MVRCSEEVLFKYNVHVEVNAGEAADSHKTESVGPLQYVQSEDKALSP